ncbi:kinase-like protein, partial [Lophiostoma macrostomum CBS 122681]
FVRTQNLVLTKSLDLEKGEKGHHCHFGQGESAQLESLLVLGRGAFGQVDKLVGSYTDPRYMSLIMSPVADMDLNKYLQQATTSRHDELRTFFGCLATALEYLHENRIRHKDIKPANILVDHGRVLFTDFGLSRDFTDAEGSTSMSMVNGLTPKYCAPEVAQHEPRNTMSDIWSLGVVFLEIIAVLKGMGIQTMYGFFRQPG